MGAMACLLLPSNAEDRVELVRTFRNVHLAAISPDSRYVLSAYRHDVTDCPDQAPKCVAEVLAAYRSDTGELQGKLTTRGGGHFGSVEFANSKVVTVFEQEWPADPELIRWDVSAGTHQRTTVPGGHNASFLCMADDRRVLALRDVRAEPWGLKIIDPPALDQQLQLPHSASPVDVGYLFRNQNCGRWRSSSSYLLGTSDGQALYWISTQPETPPSSCRTFTGEGIQDYVISPDRSMLAVATLRQRGPFQRGNVPPDQQLFLTLLNARDCSVVRRFGLSFPEKNKWRFGAQFPAEMSISADNAMLALSYGIQAGPSGYAYFGLYSLADGHRLATLRGDVDRKWPWSGFLNDEIFSQGAPTGLVEFSPDSRTFYAGSEHLRKWDVSKLK